MFPLNWNIPFIKKNGSRTTLGAITGDIAGIEKDVEDLTAQTSALWETIGQNGAKNLFDPDAITQTYKNVTYTRNVDKTYSTTGTANANGGIFFGEFLAKANVLYTLSGCPSGGSDSSYCFVVRTVKNETGAVLSYKGQNVLDVGSGVDFAVDADTTLYIQIRIENGYDTSDMVFKPMIRLASDLDPTYQPFAMTNRELTNDLANMGLVSAAPNKTSFNITYEGGKSGDMALVITSVGIGSLNYYASAWHWGSFVITSGTTITESNNSADGLTLTASGNIGLFILPLNTEGDKWAITTN